MSNEKLINSRLRQKIDTAENWAKAVNFTPLEGELIVYSDLRKFKVGDGNTLVNNLPFYSDAYIVPLTISRAYDPANGGFVVTYNLVGDFSGDHVLTALQSQKVVMARVYDTTTLESSTSFQEFYLEYADYNDDLFVFNALSGNVMSTLTIYHGEVTEETKSFVSKDYVDNKVVAQIHIWEEED